MLKEIIKGAMVIVSVETNIDVKANLAEIEAEIETTCEAVGRNKADITLIAVTKYVTTERAIEAIQAGVEDIGENRTEGFLEKQQNIDESAKWHFIGTLQSRKVRDIANQVDYIHSLDRKSLAKEINKRAEKPVNCFVQVNVSGEESKHGLDEEKAIDFVESLADYKNVRVVGLMTMAPYTATEEELRENFGKLRELRNEIKAKNLAYAPCEYLSMGMSNDFKIAIEEGATHIRIGTRLVGSELKR